MTRPRDEERPAPTFAGRSYQRVNVHISIQCVFAVCIKVSGLPVDGFGAGRVRLPPKNKTITEISSLRGVGKSRQPYVSSTAQQAP